MASQILSTSSGPVHQLTTPEAFGQRVAECRGDVLRFAYSRTHDMTTAEDITQETMLRAILSQDRFAGDITKQQFRTWLCAIAINLMRERWRHATTRKMVSVDEPQRNDKSGKSARFEIECGRPGPLAVLIHGEMADLLPEVQRWLAALPPKHRECITMYYFDGLRKREIAKRLGIHESIAHRRIVCGLEQLAAKCLHTRKPQTKKKPPASASQSVVGRRARITQLMREGKSYMDALHIADKEGAA